MLGWCRMTFTDTLLRVLSVLGLIAILLLGAWGIIQIALWIPTLFNGTVPVAQQTQTQQTAQTQPATQPAYVAPAPTPAPAPAPAKKVVTAKVATRAALYGLPDLSVSIISNSRGTVEFTVKNIGTNSAPSGWSFTANLPGASAPYVAAGQQSLRPGDGVIYTLSYNTGYNNYQNYNNSYYPNQNCGYTISYTYNGVYNYPQQNGYTCPTYYNQQYNSMPTYNGYNTINSTRYNCVGYQSGCIANGNTYPYNTYNYNNQYNNYGGVVTITVDPQNFVSEYNKSNNTVSATVTY